jgi:DNA-binding NarL/FixJ family response regulator
MHVKIAIVDDKPMVRNALRDKLRTSPEIDIVLLATNGEDFMEKIKQCKERELPDVVLMDLEMPVMDGIQAIAVASTLYENLKFIVLTVFDNNEKIFEAIKAGANGYLLKNDDAVNINKAITDLMNHNAVPMSPAIARKTLGLLRNGIPDVTSSSLPGLLSSREQEVLQLLVEGMDYRQIADKLFISPATVRTHISKIYQRLHVTSKAQAIKMVYKNNWNT